MSMPTVSICSDWGTLTRSNIGVPRCFALIGGITVIKASSVVHPASYVVHPVNLQHKSGYATVAVALKPIAYQLFQSDCACIKMCF